MGATALAVTLVMSAIGVCHRRLSDCQHNLVGGQRHARGTSVIET